MICLSEFITDLCDGELDLATEGLHDVGAAHRKYEGFVAEYFEVSPCIKASGDHFRVIWGSF